MHSGCPRNGIYATGRWAALIDIAALRRNEWAGPALIRIHLKINHGQMALVVFTGIGIQIKEIPRA
jgi:hypothetical protein